MQRLERKEPNRIAQTQCRRQIICNQGQQNAASKWRPN